MPFRLQLPGQKIMTADPACFFLDHNPLNCTTHLVEADLHNPVCVKVIKKEISMAQSLCYLKGTGTVVVSCHEDQVLQVADIEHKVKLKVSALKDRAFLIAELESLCSEGDNIFLRDAQIGTIKLVIKVTGTIQFLENLRQFYGAFSVHLKNSSTKRHTIDRKSVV